MPPARLAQIGDRFGITRRLSNLEEVLASEVDAVHLVTPIPAHAQQTLAALAAGKHCACTVPMATSLDDLHAIVAVEIAKKLVANRIRHPAVER